MRHSTYIIASTPRSGSSLLAGGLEATGIVGRPVEYFAPHLVWPWKDKWNLNCDCSWGEYLGAVMARSTTENGVRGVKMHWQHVEWLARELDVEGDAGNIIDALFPATVFINIVRTDPRAQALSFFRARKTAEWCRFPGSLRSEVDLTAIEPNYDEITRLERDLHRQQEMWLRHFTDRHATVLTVRYEDLDAEYRTEIARVLQFLGVDSSCAADLPEPHLERQSDHITKAWRVAVDKYELDMAVRK